MALRSPLTQLVLGTVAGISLFSLILAQPSRAGEPTVNPLQDIDPLDRSNDTPFSHNSDGASSVFNLINRLTLSNDRSMEDFSSEQNGNLNDAAAEFRAKQRAALQGQPQGQAVAPQPNDNLNNAAAEFRTKQQTLLQGK
jgi:hypothetical protein